jgi:putative transposase
MKKSKFSESQIAFILRQAEEGTVVSEVCRKAGISEATYYNWRKKYGGLMPSEIGGCQRRFKNPQMCRSKIPQLQGVISR